MMLNPPFFDSSLVLYWLTHREEVSRASLRAAVTGLFPDAGDEETMKVVRTTRRRLLELGHAVIGDGTGGYDRLRALPPYLVPLNQRGAVSVEVEALLCGGRTPRFLAEIAEVAAECSLMMVREPLNDAPERITLRGEPDALRRAAEVARIPIIEQAPERLSVQTGAEWRRRLATAPTEIKPVSLECQHWDWPERIWRNGLPRREKDGDLLRLTVGFGVRPCLLRHKGAWRKILSESEAKYLSAGLVHAMIARYERDGGVLVLAVLPPPELSRPLCLHTGRMAKVGAAKEYRYESVGEEAAGRWAEAFDLSLTMDSEAASGVVG